MCDFAGALNISSSLEDQFKVIRELDSSRETWAKRAVVTLDFSEGKDTYVERMTIDVKARVFSERLKEGEDILVPVGWRDRATFLEFDCRTDSGESFQLLQLKYRELFAEWLFWIQCLEKDYLPERVIPECLQNQVRSQINLGIGCEQDCRCGVGHHCEHLSIWKRILSDPEMNGFYRKLRDEQLLILALPAATQFSAVKISERKTLKQPHRTAAEKIVGCVRGVVFTANATSVKMIAPDDVRFKAVDGTIVGRGSRGSVYYRPINTQLHGDGSWVYANERTSGSRMLWRLTFTPRRSRLISPGIRITTIGIFACLWWHLTGFGASDLDSIDRISFAVVLAYYAYYMYLSDKSISNSFIYNWSTRTQRHSLTIAILSTLAFPISAHILNRLGSTLPAALQDMLKSAYPAGVALSKIAIVAILTLVLIDFYLVRSYGGPKRQH